MTEFFHDVHHWRQAHFLACPRTFSDVLHLQIVFGGSRFDARRSRRKEMDRLAHYRKDQLLAVSPATSRDVDHGMRVVGPCEAAVIYSDNTEANLLRGIICEFPRPPSWMRANTAGGAMLRAGLPTSWIIGDKTGGWNGRDPRAFATNDLAIAAPPSENRS